MTRFWTTAFLVAASAVYASAQVAEFGVAGGVSQIPSKELAGGYSLDDGWNLTFRLTINNWTYMGQEFGYSYNRSNLLLNNQQTGGMAIHQGFYNFLVYATPEGSRIRPFGTGGGHFSNFVPPGASATYGQGDNQFGFNYGGGIKFRVRDNWLFRLDYRQYQQGKPFGNSLPVSGWLRQNQITAGISFVL